MKVFKYCLLIIIIIVLSLVLFNAIGKSMETRNIKRAQSFVNSFGWNNIGLATSVETSISIKEDNMPIFELQHEQSKKIGLDYTQYVGKKVRLYAFDIFRLYDGKRVFAHVITYRNKIIGAYLQTEASSSGECQVFSLDDEEFIKLLK